MQKHPEDWAAILSADYSWETKVSIAGVEYSEDNIASLVITSGLYTNDSPAVGGCVAREIDLTVIPSGAIPRMAEIQVFVRPVSGAGQGEWIPKGTFFIDTRENDHSSGLLTIHGYDAMLKMERDYLLDGDSATGWPKSVPAVMEEIAAEIGVVLDDRNELNSSYMVEIPTGYTMREVAGFVAAANCGNWTITDAGNLRLVPLYNVSADIVSVGDEAEFLETAPQFAPFSGVHLLYDDTNGFISGDETGRVLEAFCPWATQAIADDMLSAIKGYEYQPYTALNAIVNPIAELGDSVEVGGISSYICSMGTELNGMCASDISAPADEEIDHEYPYLSPEKRELNRKVTLGQSYYGTTIDREKGLTITRVNVLGGTETRAVLNSDELCFYDENGNKVLYFDPLTGKYRFVGDVSITEGSININDKFIVDEQGNVSMSGDASIYGGKYYAGGPEDNEGYSEMTSTGFTVVNKAGQVKLTLGYTPSDRDYPFVELGSGAGTSGTKGLVKKFADGLWIGNDAPKDGEGMFSAQVGYNGIFFSFVDEAAYVVSGTTMMNIYTGDAVARFG